MPIGLSTKAKLCIMVLKKSSRRSALKFSETMDVNPLKSSSNPCKQHTKAAYQQYTTVGESMLSYQQHKKQSTLSTSQGSVFRMTSIRHYQLTVMSCFLVFFCLLLYHDVPSASHQWSQHIGCAPQVHNNFTMQMATLSILFHWKLPYFRLCFTFLVDRQFQNFWKNVIDKQFWILIPGFKEEKFTKCLVVIKIQIKYIIVKDPLQGPLLPCA